MENNQIYSENKVILDKFRWPRFIWQLAPDAARAAGERAGGGSDRRVLRVEHVFVQVAV